MKRRKFLKDAGKLAAVFIVPWLTLNLRKHPDELMEYPVVTFVSSSGDGYEFLHLVYTLGAGKVVSIPTVFVNGEAIRVGDGGDALDRYAGVMRVRWNPGCDEFVPSKDQFGKTRVESPFTDSFAQLYVRLRYDEQLWGNKVPEIGISRFELRRS